MRELHVDVFGNVQVAAPSRSKLAAYQDIQTEAIAVAKEINARFGRRGYKPIILVAQKSALTVASR